MKKLKNFALVILCLGAITMLGACDMKVSSEKTASRADQIAYLKEHEQEMTDYVKSQNPKIESVQFDWDSVQVGTIGNGTPQGAGGVLTIFAKFNDIEQSGLTVSFALKEKNDIPNMNNMYIAQPMTVEGRIYE